MEKSANLELLEIRRQYKVLVHSEKARILPSRPIHSKLQKRPKCRFKRESLNQVVKQLISEKGVTVDTEIEQANSLN
ncbi:hypothetical protein DPMN_031468 [Dreissena polymorpha]|uniref:Uncharacterized protein n=1 Tax=Dreissena polymorpha TaxID=45954 RepID=A0A9D4M017_DREPO|nr:hypothetical protein DPMN_031468 [Dreissena polymorpha]